MMKLIAAMFLAVPLMFAQAPAASHADKAHNADKPAKTTKKHGKKQTVRNENAAIPASPATPGTKGTHATPAHPATPAKK